jgi:hypothetical protein
MLDCSKELVQQEALVDFLQSYHAVPGIVLFIVSMTLEHQTDCILTHCIIVNYSLNYYFTMACIFCSFSTVDYENMSSVAEDMSKSVFQLSV